nr:MAG TPA: hypothetical protein [Caudoviricetes sp.]
MGEPQIKLDQKDTMRLIGTANVIVETYVPDRVVD